MSDSRLLLLKARAYDLIALIESAQAELREVNRQIAEEAGTNGRPGRLAVTVAPDLES